MIIQGPQVYTHDEVLQNTSVVIKDQKIAALATGSIASAEKKIVFPSTYHLLPGFIDMHVHGLAGCDVMDAELSSLEKISSMLAQEGTTGFLATTMTQSINAIEKSLSAISLYPNKMGAELLGVHLEGPFISKTYAGAQAQHYAILPDIDLFNHWQALSDNRIRLVTIAPELPGAMAFIRAVSETGVVLSIGHSGADAEQTDAAILAGCRHGTHVFNAMQGLHHRKPGTVTPLLLNEKVKVEVILDNIHIHPMVVDLIHRLKGDDGMILVTDSIRAKCLEDGEYDLGGQTVSVRQNAARLADGRLAGSVLRFPTALKHMLANTRCHLHDVMKMVSANPAKQLALFDKRGSIAPGKQADLVVLDDQLRVVLTICRGKIAAKVQLS